MEQVQGTTIYEIWKDLFKSLPNQAKEKAETIFNYYEGKNAKAQKLVHELEAKKDTLATKDELSGILIAIAELKGDLKSSLQKGLRMNLIATITAIGIATAIIMAFN